MAHGRSGSNWQIQGFKASARPVGKNLALRPCHISEAWGPGTENIEMFVCRLLIQLPRPRHLGVNLNMVSRLLWVKASR